MAACCPNCSGMRLYAYCLAHIPRSEVPGPQFSMEIELRDVNSNYLGTVQVEPGARLADVLPQEIKRIAADLGVSAVDILKITGLYPQAHMPSAAQVGCVAHCASVHVLQPGLM
jgi:hypothetical protein